LLGTVIGLRPALWLAAAGGVVGFLLLLPSPIPAFRMPSGADMDGAADGPASSTGGSVCAGSQAAARPARD
jgi:hypothetical protein